LKIRNEKLVFGEFKYLFWQVIIE